MIDSPPADSICQRRLWHALIASLLIHLSLVIGLRKSTLFVPNGTLRQVAEIHVHLPPVLSNRMQAHVPAPVNGAPPAGQLKKSPAERTLPARFIIEPDLGVLRDIPVSLGGRVHFRLHVSSIGTIGAIETLAHDPLPLDLLDGIKASLAQTMLHPAEQGGEAVDSTLDITIWFEPVSVP